MRMQQGQAVQVRQKLQVRQITERSGPGRWPGPKILCPALNIRGIIIKKENIINYSSIGLVCFHLCACGLPLAAAILGVASPFAGLVSPDIMNFLLMLAGALLAISWGFYFRGGCGCNKKLLIFSTILFIAALSLHFIAPTATGVESCH